MISTLPTWPNGICGIVYPKPVEYTSFSSSHEISPR